MIRKYEHFSLSVSRIYHDIQRIERTEMESFGLKGPHAQILLAIQRHPEGIAAVQLCELCDKDKAAVSRCVAELEEMGMVRRVSANGTNYRTPLMLTPAGEDAARTVGEKAQLAVEQAGLGLEDEERKVFYRVLAVIADNLHAICRDGLKETK